jgi:hypothetical protein
MNNKLFSTGPSVCRKASGWGFAAVLAGGLLLVGSGAQSQTPAASPAAGRANPAASAASGLGIPLGKGAGVHGANSPFPPLSARDDVVPWSVLTGVKIKVEKNRMIPHFNMTQMALNQNIQRIQGFMMPLEPGATQRHFLLSAVPLTCAFCVPGGPEGMVEVKTRTPVKYSMEPVVVEGRFLVLNDDPMGLYYRITDAASVK